MVVSPDDIICLPRTFDPLYRSSGIFLCLDGILLFSHGTISVKEVAVMGKTQIIIAAVICSLILSASIVFSALCERYYYAADGGAWRVFDKLTGNLYFPVDSKVISYSLVTGIQKTVKE